MRLASLQAALQAGPCRPSLARRLRTEGSTVPTVTQAMRIFRATPRSQDAALYDGLLLLDKAWSAAEEARSSAKEPEHCLLKVWGPAGWSVEVQGT
mgnify:CR=1 FL=1